MNLTYKNSGVNIDAGDELVKRIKPYAKLTNRIETMAGIGGFAGLMKLPSNMKKPVLVSGTDGVGTKIKIACEFNNHNTIGQDLVAMCVNDVITTGAQPLFFLDYFATSKLNVDVAEQVIAGIARACKESGCTLLGGETAELPDMYQPNEYDLAGFCVGVVEEDKIITGNNIKELDYIIGIHSSGLHSNGYSLARKALMNRDILRTPSIIRKLLKPTKLYTNLIHKLISRFEIKGIAHITGGGLLGNISRIIPKGLQADIDFYCWDRPDIFNLIQDGGHIEEDEMRKVFNLGIGMAIIVDNKIAKEVIEFIRLSNEEASHIGFIKKEV